MKKLLILLLNHVYDAQSLSNVVCHDTDEMDEEEDRLAIEEGIDPYTVNFGLCAIVRGMYNNNKISFTQFKSLNAYINKNKPKGLSSNLYLVSTTRFFWLPGNWNARIKWLEKHIKLN